MHGLFFFAIFSPSLMKGDVTMFMLENIVYKIAVHYHANMIDVNRALWILGIRDDEKAESVAKKHAMAVYEMMVRKNAK